ATRRVDVAFCFATHRDLRAAASAGEFRADLFYRIAQAEVVLPRLADRREEIPWLAAAELARTAPALALGAEAVEDLLLRPWPGNVRELLGAVRSASRAAQKESATKLRAEHLDPAAGRPLEAPAGQAPSAREHPVTRDELEAALRDEPSAAAAARRLGIHR